MSWCDMGGWCAGKDYDPDRERSEAKRLRRQLQKERRGAMRELRRDAAFLGEVTHLLSSSPATSHSVSRSQHHSEWCWAFCQLRRITTCVPPVACQRAMARFH